MIVVKKAIRRKPDHLYYIDGPGNLCETRMYFSNLTFFEAIKCLWIDFLRLFDKNKRV